MNRFAGSVNSAVRTTNYVALALVLIASIARQCSLSESKHVLGISSVSSKLMDGGAPEAASAETSSPNYAEQAIAIRHWNKRELTVYVTASADDDKTPQEVADTVSQSVALWNGKIGETLTLKVAADSADADIKISFVTPGSLKGGAIGLTDIRFDGADQAIVCAAIRVNEKLGKAELVQVIAHEMGHALGIQGHSDDRNDLMYPYAHLPAEITDRDKNTFRLGYAQQPVRPAETTETIE